MLKIGQKCWLLGCKFQRLFLWLILLVVKFYKHWYGNCIFGQTLIHCIDLPVADRVAIKRSGSVSGCKQKHTSESWVIWLRPKCQHLTGVQWCNNNFRKRITSANLSETGGWTSSVPSSYLCSGELMTCALSRLTLLSGIRQLQFSRVLRVSHCQRFGVIFGTGLRVLIVHRCDRAKLAKCSRTLHFILCSSHPLWRQAE